MRFIPVPSGARVLLGLALFAPAVISCDTVAVTSVAVASVNVVPATVELVTGQSAQLSAIATDGTGSQLSAGGVQWSATPSEIVQVDASGRLTALAPGVATISASTGGIVGNASVSVGVPGLLALSSSSLEFTTPAGQASPPSQNVQIGVGDEGTVMGLGTAVIYESGPSGWLTASLNTDRAPAVLSVSAATGALSQGVYTARVDVTSNSATNSPMHVQVTFTVTAPLPVILLGPEVLSFSGSETKSVQVTNGGGGTLSGLAARAEYDGQASGWLNASLDSSSDPASLTVTTDDLSLVPGTHTARVVVSSTLDGVTPAILSVTLQGGQHAPVLKVSPDSVLMSATVGGSATSSLNVTNVGTGVLGGLRKAIGYGAGQPTGWLVATLSSTSAPAVLSLVANGSGLAAGTYNASVEVLANAPNSPIFVPIRLTVSSAPVQPPNPPTALTATPGPGPTSVTLGWKDNSSDETRFEVRRRLKGGTWTTVATPSADAQTYVDANLIAGSTYDYQVRACNSGGCSTSWSNMATVTLGSITQPPAAPSGLTATTNSGRVPVSLAWTDNSSNETRFEVLRRLSGLNTWVRIATTGANTTSYADSTAGPGATWDYRVRACGAAGCSAPSNLVAASLLPAPTPAAPTGALATANNGGLPVTVTWTDNSTNEIRFEVRRRIVGGVYTTVGWPVPGAQSFIDVNATVGSTNQYQVRACGIGSCSSWSNVASVAVAAPVALPAPPTGLSATAANTGPPVTLTWTDQSGNETRFEVRRAALNGTWAIVASPAANAQTYLDAGVVAGAPYDYQVRACNSAGCSVWSNRASVVVPAPVVAPATPGRPVLAVVSSSAIDVSWADNSTNETRFELQRRTSSSNWAVITSPVTNATAYSDTGLQGATEYRYRVRACNSAGCSSWSSDRRATTLTSAPVPRSPTNPTILSASRQQVVIGWTDVSNNETRFEIEEGSATTSWTLIGTVNANVTSFTDTQVVVGSLIQYRVRACNAAGCSGAFSVSVLVP